MNLRQESLLNEMQGMPLGPLGERKVAVPCAVAALLDQSRNCVHNYLMGKRRKQNGICTYCGVAGEVTDDHIPPQSLFPSGTFVPYVPACRRCNGGSSGDDEHFRAVLTIRDGLDGHVVVKELLPSVIRGLERHGTRGHTGSIVATAREGPAFSPFGGWVGNQVKFTPEIDRMSRVIARIVRGHYFLHMGKRLPDAQAVAVNILGLMDIRDPEQLETVRKLSRVALDGKVFAVHRDVFVYAVGGAPLPAPGEMITVWTMTFYGRSSFMCFTVPRSDFPPGAIPY